MQIEVKLNDKDWIEVNDKCVDYIYDDAMDSLLIIVDEMAELTQKSGMKSTEAKEEDAMKDEIVASLTSIAQLGRAAQVLVVVSTQKPNATVLPTILRSNLGFRVFCGKATESGASTVSMDDNSAMLVDNTYPGAAVAKTSGTPVYFRGCYSKFKDLDDYYAKRGLDSKGYTPGEEGSEQPVQNVKLEGNIEITKDKTEKVIEFEQQKATIDARADQEWEEV